MGIYQRDEDAAPDHEFEPGAFEHLLPGNVGRLLDPRRTPISIVALNEASATFRLRIDGFEDEGATWDVPFEEVDRYQFARGGPRATADRASALAALAAGFNRPLVVPAQRAAQASTARRLGQAQQDAAAWMVGNSRWLADGAALPDPATRQGSPELAGDLDRYMATLGLDEMERRFARAFVSNPHAGELVKGHRLVIAALGLVDFRGKAIRDAALFDGDWSRVRRAEHVIARLGFVRAWLAAAGEDNLELHRGFSTEGPIRPPRNDTFVSTSFSLDVAASHFAAAAPDSHRVIASRSVPIGRVFMTYYETAAMNAPFKEAEAVLLFERGGEPF